MLLKRIYKAPLTSIVQVLLSLLIIPCAHAEYVPSSTVESKLTSIGSDTLLQLMKDWRDAFKVIHPKSDIDITAEGSSTAPPALTAGTSHLAPMSRKMKSEEIKTFELKYGYKPKQVRVALDALGIYVHKDNPIKGLTMGQVDAIFSSSSRCKDTPTISDWNQIDASLPSEKIKLFGRNSQSGTHGFFKKKALCKGDFKPDLTELIHSTEIVANISADTTAVGYSGIGYLTSGVRAVPLTKKPDTPFIEATPENASVGKYPMSRYLYIYVNENPETGIDPNVSEFLKFIFSEQGQSIVENDGYIKLPEKIIKKELSSL